MGLTDLAWDEDAWNSYQSAATSNLKIHSSLSAVLTGLEQSPGDIRFRQRRMQRPPLFIVSVPASEGPDWVILWNEADDGVPQIWFVGSDPF